MIGLSAVGPAKERLEKWMKSPIPACPRQYLVEHYTKLLFIW
jgi:hypothetical protein